MLTESLDNMCGSNVPTMWSCVGFPEVSRMPLFENW